MPNLRELVEQAQKLSQWQHMRSCWTDEDEPMRASDVLNGLCAALTTLIDAVEARECVYRLRGRMMHVQELWIAKNKDDEAHQNALRLIRGEDKWDA